MNREFQQQLKFKIIFVGDSGVGKTNIKNRFCHGSFQYASETTVGIQFSRRKFWAPIQTKSNRLFTACFWDIAGKFQERNLIPSFFKNIIGIIYVFDLTNRDSLENLRIWKNIVDDHLNVNKVIEMMIGNKNDLVQLRQVQIWEAEKFKKQLKIPLYYETSALQNLNITDAFMNYLSQIAKQGNFGLRKPLKLKKKQNLNRCYTG